MGGETADEAVLEDRRAAIFRSSRLRTSGLTTAVEATFKPTSSPSGKLSLEQSTLH